MVRPFQALAARWPCTPNPLCTRLQCHSMLASGQLHTAAVLRAHERELVHLAEVIRPAFGQGPPIEHDR